MPRVKALAAHTAKKAAEAKRVNARFDLRISGLSEETLRQLEDELLDVLKGWGVEYTFENHLHGADAQSANGLDA